VPSRAALAAASQGATGAGRSRGRKQLGPRISIIRPVTVEVGQETCFGVDPQ
jgi:hypothetical protein